MAKKRRTQAGKAAIPSAPAGQPWYERNLFGWTMGLGCALSSIGMAFGMNAKPGIALTFFVAAWPPAVVACWCISRSLRVAAGRAFVVIASIGAAVLLVYAYNISLAERAPYEFTPEVEQKFRDAVASDWTIGPQPHSAAEGKSKANWTRLHWRRDRSQALYIGCLDGDPKSCAAASWFLRLASECGWAIVGKTVHRVRPEIPREGIVLATRSLIPQSRWNELPPHLGFWKDVDSPTELTLIYAFEQLGLPVSGVSNMALPENVVGVIFGYEPKGLSPPADVRYGPDLP